jgi:hypothetical protein
LEGSPRALAGNSSEGLLLTVARMPHICGSARHATDGRVDGEAVKAKAAAVVVSIE